MLEDDRRSSLRYALRSLSLLENVFKERAAKFDESNRCERERVGKKIALRKNKSGLR